MTEEVRLANVAVVDAAAWLVTCARPVRQECTRTCRAPSTARPLRLES